MTTNKSLDTINKRIAARLKKLEAVEKVDPRNLNFLLQLYQLKAWVEGDL